MAVAKQKRLFKLASEINIGKETIVSYLQSRGYDIENKPTAKLNEEMVNLVHDKFKREMRAAEVQREKIEKHKGTTTKKVSKEKLQDDDPDIISENGDKSADIETSEEVKISEEAVAEDNSSESKEVDDGLPKIGEVIELPDRRGSKPQRTPQSPIEKKQIEQEPAPVEKTAEIKAEDLAGKHEPVAKKEETPKAATQEHKPKEVQEPKSTEPTKAKVESESKQSESDTAKKYNEAKAVEAKAVEAKDTTNVQKEEIKSEQKQTPVSQSDKDSRNKIDPKDTTVKNDDSEFETDSQGNRRRKKRKNIVEVEPGEAPQLRGLTVLGKIEVEKAQSKKDKPKRKLRPGVIDDDEIEVIKSKPKKRKRKDKSQKVGGEGEAPKAKSPAPATGPAKAKDDKRNKRKRKKSIREQISQEDVEKAIKQTLSGMDGGAGSSRAKFRQKKRQEREVKEQRHQEEQEHEKRTLKLTEYVTTSDLANMMDILPNEIILKCMELGLMVTINQRLDKDTLALIADDYGFDVEFVDEKQVSLIEDQVDAEEDLRPRPPIVTIMGHVDHGKTSLLDFIRKANVVSGEAGGITQHIGAYRVPMPNNKSITFLDTPGHEAFTAMRARGAQVTDIVVLVVAADDSVMPQTVEAISHASAANVPIIVAINKIDKPDANPDRIKQQLADHGVLAEDWGGKHQTVELSAKKGINVDTLLEKILLEAEMIDMKANPNRNARGVVIESNMTKGLGSTATIIVQKGTLKVGDPFVAGVYAGRVRAMLDETGAKVEEVGPSDPVLVIGFEGLPEAGDNFVITETDTEAREIATERKQLKREQEMRQVRHVTLDQISQQIQVGGVQELHLVIKADVGGSAEALADSLLKLSTEEVKVKILHKGVGAITETDVMLAAASQAVVIGFNVSPSGQSRKLAEKEFVDIRKYDIIYDCINEVQLALEGLLTPEQKEEITSEVEVRETFKISKLGTVAGCYVLNGKIKRNDKVRLLRDGLKVYEGTVSSLKRGKDDVKEVDQKYECGIQLENFNDIKTGDIIESYKIVEIKRTLS